ncbi:MAG TPA: YqcC family protein [Motiliproteus sp.]
MSVNQRQQLRSCLYKLEEELQRLNLWSAQPPAPEAMASTAPFCIDTLNLSEWIQWLMIPRIHSLLDNDQALPTSCNVRAIAEESFKQLEQDINELLHLIEEIDSLITRNP